MEPDFQTCRKTWEAERPRGPENDLSCVERGAKRTGLHLWSGNSGLGVGGGGGTCMRHKEITSTSRDSQRVSATRRRGILSFCDSPSLNQLHCDRWTPGSLLLLLKLAYLITPLSTIQGLPWEPSKTTPPLPTILGHSSNATSSVATVSRRNDRETRVQDKAAGLSHG